MSENDRLTREDSYWDAFIAGQWALHPIESEMEQTIVRTFALDDASAPNHAFVHSLKESLMQIASALPSRPLQLLTPRDQQPARPYQLPAVRPMGSSTSVSRMLAYAVAAVLILGVVGALSISRYGDRDVRQHLANGPSIIAPGTPTSPDRDEDVLFEITLPGDVVSADSPGSMALSWDTIPANSVTTRNGSECCHGSIIYFILEGSVIISGDGPIQVIRHDGAGAIETHGASEPANLGPGDLVVVRFEDAQTWTTGAAKVELISQDLASGTYPGSWGPAEWPSNVYTYDLHSVVLPGGPYLLSLSQVVVEADTTFDLPDNVVNQLAILKEGRASVGSGTDNVLRVINVHEPVTLCILTLSTTADGTGTPVAGMGSVAASPTP